VVPGTLRDSLFILDALHARNGGPKPETVITDTASYSDIVFGLFAICGYQFRYAFTRPPAPGTRPLRDPREPDSDSTEEE
jgi:TnpA family transposase